MIENDATTGTARGRTAKAFIVPAVVLAVLVAGGALRTPPLPASAWVFLAGTTGWLVIRTLYGHRGTASMKASDSLERVLLALVAIGMMLVPALYLTTNLFGFADIELPVVVHIVGAACVVAGTLLFERAHRDLGSCWSPTLALTDKHRLVAEGVYRHVRHPMYSALFLIAIAQALLIDNLIAGLAGLVSFGLLYLLRVDKEEAMLEAEFGPQWRIYAARTPRLVPRLVRTNR